MAEVRTRYGDYYWINRNYYCSGEIMEQPADRRKSNMNALSKSFSYYFIYEQQEGQTNRRTDGGTDERTDGWTGGHTDIWMQICM